MLCIQGVTLNLLNPDVALGEVVQGEARFAEGQPEFGTADGDGFTETQVFLAELVVVDDRGRGPRGCGPEKFEDMVEFLCGPVKQLLDRIHAPIKAEGVGQLRG